MIDIVTPVYSNTAANIPLLSKMFCRTMGKQKFRLNIICDNDDPSYAWLKNFVSLSHHDIRLFSTYSYINEDAFISAISGRSI